MVFKLLASRCAIQSLDPTPRAGDQLVVRSIEIRVDPSLSSVLDRPCPSIKRSLAVWTHGSGWVSRSTALANTSRTKSESDLR